MKTELLKNLKVKINRSLCQNAKINRCHIRTFQKYWRYYGKENEFYERREKMFKDELQAKIEEIIKKNPSTKASRLYQFMNNDPLLMNKETNNKYCLRTFRRKVEKAKKKWGKSTEIPVLINHIEGKQLQVDWKESLKIRFISGEGVKFNVLGITSPYSQKIAFILTKDRKQYTLLNGLALGLEKFGGTTDEMKFDNMKTVVDYTKSTTKNKVYNSKILQFGNDYNMKISTTEPYNPQGKGTIEAKMKFLDNLDLYDRRLHNWKELENIIQNIEDEANKSIRKTEKLNHLPRENIRKHYIEKREQLTVARSSTILYKNTRYSVKPRYIGQKCWIKEQKGYLCIYDLYGFLIRKHKLTQKQNCYHLKDFKTIITQPKYIKYKKKNETVEEFVIAQFKRLGGN